MRYVLYPQKLAKYIPFERKMYCSREMQSKEETSDLVISIIKVKALDSSFKEYMQHSITKDKLSKIDQLLVCNNFLGRWPQATLTALLREGMTDHCPLLLKTSIVNQGPIRFRFFNSWAGIQGFDEMIAKDLQVFPLLLHLRPS